MSKNILIFLVSGILFSCQTQEPTRWRGPSGNGIYQETGLLKEWPTGGPEILWTFDSLGIGYSSAVIQNGFLFTTGMIDSTGYLFKFNLQGDLVYNVPYGIEFTGSYKGTRGSPVVVGKKIYLESGRGQLICFNNEDGSVLWSKDLFTAFDGKNIRWGLNETPVVDENIIYATPGGVEYNVVALDRHSGNLIWSCKGEGEVSAYCTPLLFEHNGRKILSTYTKSHLLGLDASTGELLWSEDRPWEWSVHSSTPLYQEGELYYMSGHEKGGGKLKLNEDGSSVSLVWENQVCDYRYGAVLYDGYIYESFGEDKRVNWHWLNRIRPDSRLSARQKSPRVPVSTLRIPRSMREFSI
ncbi:MAG: PQQ-like beta-propeller repeat protein [Bacteroidales bacterium]|nr:PQQ-like beta-propeller repeat protein [Bacteroidales bacterium]